MSVVLTFNNQQLLRCVDIKSTYRFKIITNVLNIFYIECGLVDDTKKNIVREINLLQWFIRIVCNDNSGVPFETQDVFIIFQIFLKGIIHCLKITKLTLSQDTL